MATPSTRSRSIPVVPPAHGAWAFIGLPVAVAAAVSPAAWIVLVLAAAWVLAYPASYFGLALVRETSARHPAPRRYVRPLVIWAVPAALLAVVALALQPWLVWVGLGYGVLFAVNALFARRRDERSLVNDAVLIVECAAIVPVTYAAAVGARGWRPPGLDSIPAEVWILCLAVALVLLGSTLHVKSLIRERADARFTRASRAFAVVCLPIAAGLAAWWGLPAGLLLLVPFGYLAVRAFAVRAGRVSPVRIGMLELVGYLLLAVAAFVLAVP